MRARERERETEVGGREKGGSDMGERRRNRERYKNER
jgi:hypothetical protein